MLTSIVNFRHFEAVALLGERLLSEIKIPVAGKGLRSLKGLLKIFRSELQEKLLFLFFSQ